MTWGLPVPIALLAMAGVVAIAVGLVASGVGNAVVPRGGSVPVIAGALAPASGATSTRVAGAGAAANRKSAPSVGTEIDGSLASERPADSVFVDDVELNVLPGIGVMSDWPAPVHGVVAGGGPPGLVGIG